MPSLPSPTAPPEQDPSTFSPPDPDPQRAPEPATVLIIGAGLAGLRSVGELRAQGFKGRITVVGAEDVPPYDRPPLSKHLLDKEEPVWLTEDLGIEMEQADEVLLGVAVTSLTTDASPVDASPVEGPPPEPRYRAYLTDGRILQADAVIIACGSVPRVRHEWGGALSLHSSHDAATLRTSLRGTADHTPHLVCIGAGWIGAELSGHLAKSGFKVTVVEATPSPLFTSLGSAVGALTAPWYTDVELITGALVAEVQDNRVTLDDGRILNADVVFVAIGARPATDWLAGSIAGQVPLLPDGSIDVDSHMRPVDSRGEPVRTLAGVRAVGDCASRRSARHGRVPGGHWDAALRGPVAAVASLLGGPAPEEAPDPAPYVFSTQFGRELVLYGQPRADDDVVLRGDPGAAAGEAGWAALFFARLGGDASSDPAGSGRVLTAILTVDRPRDVAAARRLFGRADLPRLDPHLAADPNVKLTAAIAD